MFRKTFLIPLYAVLMVVALLASACSAAATPEELRNSASGITPGDFAQSEVGSMPPALSDQDANKVADGLTAANYNAQAQTDRLIIQNISLSLIVKSPIEINAQAASMAQELGGFVVNSNVYQVSTDAAGNKVMRANLSLRVPADKLEQAIVQLKGLAVSVESEARSGEDVTAQYTDLESQLRNLEAAEAQLTKIMEGANKTEDVLNVYNQLVNVRGQIEQTKGQMKYYRESAAMSLITLDLIPDALSQPIQVGGWKAEGEAKAAIEALINSLQEVASAMIWGALYLLPLALIFGLPLLLIGVFIWRRVRKTATPRKTETA